MIAVAQGCPPLATGTRGRGDSQAEYLKWLQSRQIDEKDAWLAQLISDPDATVRRSILTEFHTGREVAAWPTVFLGRTIEELLAAERDVAEIEKRKADAKAERAKVKRLATIATKPEMILRETEALVKQRGSTAYEKIALLLAELREALAGTPQANLAEKQAEKLRSKNPTLKVLVGSLRRQGFLSK